MNKDEVKKFADLARIEISDDELLKMSGEIDAVLHYVDQIKTAVGDFKDGEIASGKFHDGKTDFIKVDNFVPINVFREGDSVSENKLAQSTANDRAQLLAEAPEISGDYVKVKKIL